MKDSAAVSLSEIAATPFTNNDDERVDGVTEADPATETVNSLRLSLKVGMMLLKESTAIISIGTLSPAAIFWGILISKWSNFPGCTIMSPQKDTEGNSRNRKKTTRDRKANLPPRMTISPPCKE